MTYKKRKPFSVKRRLSKLEKVINKMISELEERIDAKFDDLDGEIDHAIELLVELLNHVEVPDPALENKAPVPTCNLSMERKDDCQRF